LSRYLIICIKAFSNPSLFVGQLDATYMDVADKSQIRNLDKNFG
jgi:fibrillarin-like rRNA methylase